MINSIHIETRLSLNPVWTWERLLNSLSLADNNGIYLLGFCENQKVPLKLLEQCLAYNEHYVVTIFTFFICKLIYNKLYL